jgi:uncharacterized membrane protein YkoI
MMRKTLLGSLVLLWAGAAMAWSIQQPGESDRDWTPFVMAQQVEEREPGPADLEEAIEIAVKRYGGELAGAATVERDGRRVHEIRLLVDDTSVRTVRIDPDTGAIIPQGR